LDTLTGYFIGLVNTYIYRFNNYCCFFISWARAKLFAFANTATIKYYIYVLMIAKQVGDKSFFEANEMYFVLLNKKNLHMYICIHMYV